MIKALKVIQITEEIRTLLTSELNMSARIIELTKQIDSSVSVDPTINYVIDGREANIEDNYLDPVTYVPNHAKGNAGHSDCEQGVLINMTERAVFVLFSKSRTTQAVNADNLVWG